MSILSAITESVKLVPYIIKIILSANNVVPTAIGMASVVKYLKDFSYAIFKES